MNCKYDSISSEQISSIKKIIRKNIFFLLLYVDPKTKYEYTYVDVNKAFDNIFHRLNGFNKILLCPTEVLTTMSILSEAQDIYNTQPFDFSMYRKLILDAGAEIEKIKEGC